MTKYYYLKKDDIIQRGDEVEASNSIHDEPKWETTNEACVNTLAPNPIFPAHRQYRRSSSEPTPTFRKLLDGL